MVKLAPMVVLLSLGIAGGCSTSVNALFLDDAGETLSGPDAALSSDSGAPGSGGFSDSGATGTAGTPDASAEGASGSAGAGNSGADGGEEGSAPAGLGALPSLAQVAYQRAELTAFLHFGLGTFDGTEYGDASQDSASLFNPTDFDATEWVRVLKDAGFRQAMLTAKHATGFCLWPSAYTDYSVKNSPWKDGKGDVVEELTRALHAAGMRVGIYLSPWDTHYPSGSTSYATYFKNQLTELLSNYGTIDEVYFDGYDAPSLDWKSILQLAKTLQPDILVGTGPEIAASGADLRWIGNQSGISNRSISAVGDVPNGGPSGVWYPPEAPVSDRMPNWFWHPSDSVISLSSLQTIYFDTVGMNATLLLNVPPANSGQFDTSDVALLTAFASWYAALYATNVVHGQPATADSSWDDGSFAASSALDDDLSTYWAAAPGRASARLVVTPSSAITFSVLSIREPIEIGEHTTAYHVELKQEGTWRSAPVDESGAVIKGTIIGQRQLWKLASTTAEAIALVIDSAKDVPAIAELGAY